MCAISSVWMVQPGGTEMDINKLLRECGGCGALSFGLQTQYLLVPYSQYASASQIFTLLLPSYMIPDFIGKYFSPFHWHVCHISSILIPLVQRIHQSRGCGCLTITLMQGEWFQTKFKHAGTPEATPVMQGKEGSDDQTTKEKDQMGHSQRLYWHQSLKSFE